MFDDILIFTFGMVVGGTVVLCVAMLVGLLRAAGWQVLGGKRR